MNVLVTGIAGDIGNGIGRILKEVDFVERLVGCDIHTEHMGPYIFDACHVVPRAADGGYVAAMAALAANERLDAIVVTSEPELRFFADAAARGQPVALPLVMANQHAMVVGFDKLTTAEFVAALGCPSPWTLPVDGGEPQAYPCILKSRVGAGSQGVYVVRDPAWVEAYRTLFPGYIWQEYMADDDNEYTCGVYGCADGTMRSMVFRRRLVSGVTGYAELVRHAAIETLCETVGKALDLRGSINIQLRLGPRGPMIFEINPRFSSTVVFRHKLGFQDLVWSLQEQILGQAAGRAPLAAAGTRVYRAFDEIVSA